MDMLFARCWEHATRGLERDYVTGNNDADGVYFLHWARRVGDFDEKHLRAKLAEWGGNSSGVNVANIDNLGNVHPDTMWWDCTLGNVRSRAFSAIWTDTRHPVMAGLGAAAPIKALRHLRLFRHLRRQYARARDEGERRPVGRGPGVLPRR